MLRLLTQVEELEMATWKKLTDATTDRVSYVNLDLVLVMERAEDRTTLWFGEGRGNRQVKYIKESPEEVMGGMR